MSPAARLRQAQRRCWCILLALLLALILALGALLGGAIDFSYGEWRSRWRSEKRDGRDSTPDVPAASTPQRAETHAKRYLRMRTGTTTQNGLRTRTGTTTRPRSFERSRRARRRPEPRRVDDGSVEEDAVALDENVLGHFARVSRRCTAR